MRVNVDSLRQMLAVIDRRQSGAQLTVTSSHSTSTTNTVSNTPPLVHQASAGGLMLCRCYFLSSLSVFFDDRLEQRDLGNYKTNLHQIFRGGRHVGVPVDV